MTSDKPGPTITEAALTAMVRTALRMANPPDTLRLVVWRKNAGRPMPDTVLLWGHSGPRSSQDVSLRVLYRDSRSIALLGAFRLADIVLWYREKRLLDEPACEACERW